MPEPRLPRYPLYVISKGRADCCFTAKFLLGDGVPFRLVIEPTEFDAYASRFPEELLEVLPFADLGQGSIPARNWVWEHAKATGAARHWIFDDNIRGIRRWYRGERIPCAAAPALRVIEDFTDRYKNVGIAGMNYLMFGLGGQPPFLRNVHVYSNLLIDNAIPQRWRGRYNEDTDLCLQVLAAGLCTLQVNVFLAFKVGTMRTRGGNTEELYAGDGRLRMARSLERLWPGVVRVDRRYGRPQHVVNWRRFTTPLQLREDVDLAQLAANPDEYGLRLDAVKPVKAPRLQRLQSDYAS